MTVIREDDVIASVRDALQYISYYHAPDFIRAMGRAYQAERSPAARDAIAQILTNSRLCAEGHRPLCQDTGIVVAFVDVGMGVRFDGSRDLEAMINEGVRRAYLNPDNKLRASIVSDPAGNARHRHRRQRGESHAAREEILDGAHRYSRARRARRAHCA